MAVPQTVLTSSAAPSPHTGNYYDDGDDDDDCDRDDEEYRESLEGGPSPPAGLDKYTGKPNNPE